MAAAHGNILHHFNLAPIQDAGILDIILHEKEEKLTKAEKLKRWMAIIPENIMKLINLALNQERPFLPPDVTPEMMASPNEFVPSLNHMEILYYCLYEAIEGEDYNTAAAIAYVVDRATYRFGSSRALLKVVDVIKTESPDTPVAPQLVIRKARIMKDDGDLHGAMRVLDAVISRESKWDYKTEDQYMNVKAVCVQVKGQILHNLGLWKEAIDPLVQSVESFNRLHDDKGTSSSLGLLTRCLNKLSVQDFFEVKQKFPQHFQSNHPCYEAFVQGMAAVRYIEDLGKTLYLYKHQLAAEESLLMFAVQQQAGWEEYRWFQKIVHEMSACLAGHQTVDFLRSAETFFEFVRALFMISITLWFSPIEQDKALSKYLEQLSVELYRHLCDQSQGELVMNVKHTSNSVKLMNTALSLLGLSPLQGSETFDTDLTSLKTSEQSSESVKLGEETAEKDSSTKQRPLGEMNERLANDVRSSCDQQPDVSVGETHGCAATYSNYETASNSDKNQSSTFPVASSKSKQSLKKSVQKFVGLPITHENMLSSSINQTDELDPENVDEPLEVINISVTEISAVDRSLINDSSPIMELSKASPTSVDKSDFNSVSELQGHSSEKLPSVAFSSAADNTTSSSSGKSSSLVDIDATTESSSRTTNSNSATGHTSSSSGKSSSLVNMDATTKSSFNTTDSDLESSSSDSSGLSPLVDLTCSTVDSDTLDSLKLGESVSSNDLTEYFMKWTPSLSDEENGPKVYRGQLCTYNPVTGGWTKQSTIVHLGTELEIPEGKKGKCRDVFHIQFLHQDEPLGKYVCKRYKKQRDPQRYIQDVICQMTAGYYVTKFNQQLQRYKTDIQVQFLPVAHLQLFKPDGILTDWVNIEPFLSGNFDKLTNNLEYFNVKGRQLATALTHFSYCESQGVLMIVDLQGWLPDDDSGIVYLTDPQFNTQGIKKFSSYDQQEKGMRAFWDTVHPECNDICRFLQLARPN